MRACTRGQTVRVHHNTRCITFVRRVQIYVFRGKKPYVSLYAYVSGRGVVREVNVLRIELVSRHFPSADVPCTPPDSGRSEGKEGDPFPSSEISASIINIIRSGNLRFICAITVGERFQWEILIVFCVLLPCLYR